MIVEVSKAPMSDKPLLQRMMELYLYDFSEFDGSDLNADGYFGDQWLDYYWSENERHPFIVRVDGKLAGFALVNQYTYLPRSEWSIAEFFIMRKYRGKGIGKKVAFNIFDQFHGRWEVHELESNKPAHQFWRKVISDYTHGNYSETSLDNERSSGPIQCFENIQKD